MHWPRPIQSFGSWLSERFELSRHRSELAYREPMEGLRGLAMTLVFLVHFVALVWPKLQAGSATLITADVLQALGRAGVDLFFLFSGFLVYGSLIKRPRGYGDLIKRRIRRIYPTFTVIFLIYIALSFVFPEQNRIPAGWKEASIYLLENYLLLPGMFRIEPMITVAWSLSYDTFFFLTIPLVIGALGLRRRMPMTRLLLFLAITVAGMAYTATHGGRVRLLMFIAGVVLYELMQLSKQASVRVPAWLAPLALAFVFTACLVSSLMEGPWLDFGSNWINGTVKTACMFVGFNVLCLATFQNPGSRFSRMLSFLPLRWLGNMSYSYYLMHGLALKATAIVLERVIPGGIDPNGAMFFVLLPVMYAATLVTSAVLFLTIERPFSLTVLNTPAKDADSTRSGRKTVPRPAQPPRPSHGPYPAMAMVSSTRQRRTGQNASRRPE